MQTVVVHEPDEMESLVKRLGAREMEFLVSETDHHAGSATGAAEDGRTDHCYHAQAEDTLITIESRFRHEKFHFIKVRNFA